MKPIYSAPRLLALALCLAPATGALAQVTSHPGDVDFAGDLTIDNGNGVGDLYVENDSILDGNVCMGNTCNPSETFANDVILRLKYTANTIEFVDTSGSTAPSQDWSIRANDEALFANGGINRFSIDDDTAVTTPFTIEGGAPTNAFWLAPSGNLGLGTSLPQANLHIAGAAPRILVEQSGSKASREMFAMKNNGGSYFTLDNTDSGTTWYFVHENNTPNRFIITDGVADGPEMTISAEGDLEIQGQLYTAGSCSAGCDRVFDEDYPLPSIAQQTAMMREMRHLPNVGPTPENGPFNITAMTGGMLNELEKAHLYIAQLHEESVAQEQRIARLEALVEALAPAD